MGLTIAAAELRKMWISLKQSSSSTQPRLSLELQSVTDNSAETDPLQLWSFNQTDMSAVEFAAAPVLLK